MESFKDILKRKIGKKISIRGESSLNPPATNNTLMSSSSMAVLDLLAEGPIEGLSTKDGRRSEGMDLLESVFLDGIRVKNPTFEASAGKRIPYENIELVGRLETGAIEAAFFNISGSLREYERFLTKADVSAPGGVTAYNASLKIREIDGFKSELLNFITENSGDLGRYAFMQYLTSGIFEPSDGITGRGKFDPGQKTSYNQTTFNHFATVGTSATGGHLYKRTIQKRDGSLVEMPKDMQFAIPGFFNSDPFVGDYAAGGSYPPLPEHVGKVGSGLRLEGFYGGGIIFFDAGTGYKNDPTPLTSTITTETDNTHSVDNTEDVTLHFGPGLTGYHTRNQRNSSNIHLFEENFTTAGFIDFSGTTEHLQFANSDGPFGVAIDTNDAMNLGGYFKASGAGDYTFHLSSDDRSYVWIGDNGAPENRTIDNYTITSTYSSQNRTAVVSMEAGRSYPFYVMYENGAGADKLQIKVQPPGGSYQTGFNGFWFHTTGATHLSASTGMKSGSNIGFEPGYGVTFVADFRTRKKSDFPSGKFFIQSGRSDFDAAVGSGISGDYDVFAFKPNGGMSFANVVSTQKDPLPGEFNNKFLNLTFTDDFLAEYNFNNISFNHRKGYEQQPVLEGYDIGAQDFDVRKKLYGPLRYGGAATGGSGDEAATGIAAGYSDSRGGGDFSAWSTNFPTEHDGYPYTWTVKRPEVKKVYPTLSIEALSNTIDNGDNAGQETGAQIAFSIEYGFEGDIPNLTASTLTDPTVYLQDGKSLQSIYLTLQKQSLNKTYEGVTTSAYLNTVRELNDLPQNKALQNVRVDDTSIPGLTDADITSYTSYNSGDLLFPGEEWKNINRYMKVQKLSFETDSTLISREASLNYVTEEIGESFSYPYAALSAFQFDARTFAQQPTREYDAKLKKVLIPSNYFPLDTKGKDKRFVNEKGFFDSRAAIEINATTDFAIANQDITIGTEDVEIEFKYDPAEVYPKTNGASVGDFIITKAGGSLRSNGFEVFHYKTTQTSQDVRIAALVTKSTANEMDKQINISLEDRINNAKLIPKGFDDYQYLGEFQNKVSVGSSKPYRSDGTGEDIDVTFDLLIGENVSSNDIMWTGGSYNRLEIIIRNGKFRLEYVSNNGFGNKVQSDRIFKPFELVKLQLVGTLQNGVQLKDTETNTIICEITADGTAGTNSTVVQLIDTFANAYTAGEVISNGPYYILGVNSHNPTPSRKGYGAMRNLIQNGTTVFTDDMFGVGGFQRTDTTEHTIGSKFPQRNSDIYICKLSLVGQTFTFRVTTVGGELVGEGTETMSTARGSISFAGSNRLTFGRRTNDASTNVNPKSIFADIKITKAGTIIHNYIGDIAESAVSPSELEDSVGGNNLKFQDTIPNSIEVSTFGSARPLVYNGHWDGSFRLGWTDNPAWILYDLMINPIYGIGNNLDDRQDIDIFRLYDLARYCDAVDSDGHFVGVPDATEGLEPRFSANLLIKEPKNAYETIGNIASIFRAIAFWDGASLNFSMDRPKGIHGIFNNGNVFDGIFNYGDITKESRFNRVEVFYADAKDDFQIKTEYVEDEESIRKHGLIVTKNNGIGCTSKSQARRMGKFILLSNRNETEIVSFRAGHEAMLLGPGDVIRIDDELKNFEINYGKILEVNTGSNYAGSYLGIGTQVSTGSISTGLAVNKTGGIYVNDNKIQTPLKDLYDIANFDTTYTFEGTQYTGEFPFDKISGANAEQVTQFYITGMEKANDNQTNLLLDTGDANFTGITGIRQGHNFNIQLNNNIQEYYKVIKLRPVENNLFEIEALQYDSGKYHKVESEDFDTTPNNYNIGIPSHTVNRPTTPTFVGDTLQEGDLSFSYTGLITAQGNKVEDKYRVTVLKQNLSAPYVQREFLKAGDTTPFKLHHLKAGTYVATVVALKNPESSQNSSQEFTINEKPLKWVNPFMSNITLINGDTSSYSSNSGSGSIHGESVDYRLTIKNRYDESVILTHQQEYTFNVYANMGTGYKLIDSNYRDNSYVFSQAKNYATFGQFTTGYELKFELQKNGESLTPSTFYTSLIPTPGL
jgi:hypothetical protein